MGINGIYNPGFAQADGNSKAVSGRACSASLPLLFCIWGAISVWAGGTNCSISIPVPGFMMQLDDDVVIISPLLDNHFTGILQIPDDINNALLRFFHVLHPDIGGNLQVSLYGFSHTF